MKYREHKQKPVKSVNKNTKPVNTQEFATTKVYKLGELPPEPKPKKAKKRLKLPKLKIGEIKLPKKLSSVPKTAYKKSVNSFKSLTRRQKYILIVALILVLVVGAFALSRDSGSDKPNNTPKVAGKASRKISFTPLVAPGKSLIVDPEGKRDTGSYADKIGQINIRVSEQPVPATFKPDASVKLAEFAKNNYYAQQLKVGETVVYYGMSIKGVQSVVFIKSNLLIFIKAEQKLEDTRLTDYISSMQ